MLLARAFIPILVLFCSLTATIFAQDDDEEGTIVSQNPLIPGEEVPTADSDMYFATDLDDGDLQLTLGQKVGNILDRLVGARSDGTSAKTTKSAGITKSKYRWPGSLNGQTVLIPYTIQGGVYTTDQLALIQQAMYDIQNVTCIRFIKRNKQKDYFQIFSKKGKGCYSALGRTGGLQFVSLNKIGCINRKAIVHELIHVIGFNHMFRRFDRDDYVDVWFGNVIDKYRSQFYKLNNRNEAFNTPFDLLSAMMYRSHAFSKNGKNTVVPHDISYLDRIGAVTTLSKGDALRINRMYNCPSPTAV